MGIASFLFGQSDEEKAQEAQTDARLRAINERDYGKGGVIYNAIEESQGAFAADNALGTVEKHLANDELDTATGDQQIDTAFDTELSRRTGAVRNAAGSGISAVFKSIFGIIPWQVWLAGAAFAFFYFGGFKFLKGKLKL